MRQPYEIGFTLGAVEVNFIAYVVIICKICENICLYVKKNWTTCQQKLVVDI